jgi:hypothetical protein
MDEHIEKTLTNVAVSQECSVLHLITPGIAQVCDCGYSSETHLGGTSIGNL